MGDNEFTKLVGSKPAQTTKDGKPPKVDDDGVEMPDLSGDYRASSHFRSKFMPCLFLYFNAEERKEHHFKKKQVQYVHLEVDDPESGFKDDGKSFSLVFGENRLIVTGRDIEGIYDDISQHRLAWIRCIDNQRNFVSDGPVITGITLMKVEKK